jgi:GNAT superfamily N-acetyltransferase
VRFRSASEADVRALVELINAAYEPVDFWLFGVLRTDAEQLHVLLADREVSLVVAELDSGLAGHVELSFRHGRAMFGLLATASPARGRGVGTLLVEEAERRARAAGFRAIWLECVRENGLEDYYDSLGYRTVATEEGRMWDARHDWTLARMKKDL